MTEAKYSEENDHEEMNEKEYDQEEHEIDQRDNEEQRKRDEQREIEEKRKNVSGYDPHAQYTNRNYYDVKFCLFSCHKLFQP